MEKYYVDKRVVVAGSAMLLVVGILLLANLYSGALDDDTQVGSVVVSELVKQESLLYDTLDEIGMPASTASVWKEYADDGGIYSQSWVANHLSELNVSSNVVYGYTTEGYHAKVWWINHDK
jgi:hypothetical protein